MKRRQGFRRFHGFKAGAAFLLKPLGRVENLLVEVDGAGFLFDREAHARGGGQPEQEEFPAGKIVHHGGPRA